MYRTHEAANAATAMDPGPLGEFLAKVNVIQRLEEARKRDDAAYGIRVHVSIITARNAPAHLRAVQSLKARGVTVNDAFFLGGIDKGRIVEVLKPHIFFDDQTIHLEGTSKFTPSVHIPFGVTNE